MRSSNALGKALERGRANFLVQSIEKVRAVAGTLPDDVEVAIAAVRLAEAAMVEPPASTPEAHRRAVESFKASARTGGTLDPGKAAQTLTRARAADLAATTGAELADTAFTELVGELADVGRRHGEDLLAMIRPRTLAAYADLTAAVAELPIGVDPSKPLDYGAAVASTLAEIATHTETIGEFYAIRSDLIADGVLSPITVDRGGHFLVVREMWRFERPLVIAGNAAVAGFVQPLSAPVLPAPGLSRWIRLCRVGASAYFWAPSPSEQDAVCRRYLELRRSNSVPDEFDDSQLAVISAGRNW
jgi:hypothetical protein